MIFCRVIFCEFSLVPTKANKKCTESEQFMSQTF